MNINSLWKLILSIFGNEYKLSFEGAVSLKKYERILKHFSEFWNAY